MDDICAIAGIHAAELRADSDFFDHPEAMRVLSRLHKSAPLIDPRTKTKAPAKSAQSQLGMAPAAA